MTNYYVYYRVEATRIEFVRVEIENIFVKIQKKFGIRGRWMRRRDEATTYMEVYEGVKKESEFEAMLERESAKFGLERQIERFIGI